MKFINWNWNNEISKNVHYLSKIIRISKDIQRPSWASVDLSRSNHFPLFPSLALKTGNWKFTNRFRCSLKPRKVEQGGKTRLATAMRKRGRGSNSSTSSTTQKMSATGGGRYAAAGGMTSRWLMGLHRECWSFLPDSCPLEPLFQLSTPLRLYLLTHNPLAQLLLRSYTWGNTGRFFVRDSLFNGHWWSLWGFGLFLRRLVAVFFLGNIARGYNYLWKYVSLLFWRIGRREFKRSRTNLGELVVEMKFNDSVEHRVAREKMLIILEKNS